MKQRELWALVLMDSWSLFMGSFWLKYRITSLNERWSLYRCGYFITGFAVYDFKDYANIYYSVSPILIQYDVK